jgi:hypothetical protein
MQFFQELGALVERRWRDRNYRETDFPEIAAEALAETNPNQRVDPWEVIRWLHTTDQLPSQQDILGNFGNPPITLYCGPRFYIDIYFWLDGTTTIHEHCFAGAFLVLLGSSIHSRYSFRQTEEVNAHFAIGQIDFEGLELLKEGDIKRIIPGREYIHSLFHLDRPSATLTVRTYQSPSYLPQYNYHRPHFAIDPFYKEPSMTKKVQSISLLLGMKHPEADALIGDLISNSDFETAFAVLDLAFHSLVDDPVDAIFNLSTGKERFDQLLEKARRRHGGLADLLIPVFEEAERQSYLVTKRRQITGSEHRFFLALLLNVPDRSMVLDAVKQRFPEREPVDTVIEWMDQLSTTKVLGSSEKNVLGIDGIDDDYLCVFQCLLEGRSLEQTRRALAKEYAGAPPPDLGEKVAELSRSIRQSILFKSIFADQTAGHRGAASRQSSRPRSKKK